MHELFLDKLKWPKQGNGVWEEQPEYQKNQAKLIGFLIVLVFALYIGYSISNKDWDLLKNVIEFAGIFIAALAAFPICAWLIVKFIRKIRDKNGSPLMEIILNKPFHTPNLLLNHAAGLLCAEGASENSPAF